MVLLVYVSVIGSPLPTPLAVPPVIPPVITGTGHVNVTPEIGGTLAVVIDRFVVPPLHIVSVRPGVITGSGLIKSVTFSCNPEQPSELTGIIEYITLTALPVVFVHASSSMTFAVNPEPVEGAPADALSPFVLIAVILYVIPEQYVRSWFVIESVRPDAASLHGFALNGERSGISFISKLCAGIHGPSPHPLTPLTVIEYVPFDIPERSIEF